MCPCYPGQCRRRDRINRPCPIKLGRSSSAALRGGWVLLGVDPSADPLHVPSCPRSTRDGAVPLGERGAVPAPVGGAGPGRQAEAAVGPEQGGPVIGLWGE